MPQRGFEPLFNALEERRVLRYTTETKNLPYAFWKEALELRP